MALQMAAALCLFAALLQFLGGNLFFLLASIGYAVSAVGLFEQSRAVSRWGAVAAGTCASLNGLVNLAMIFVLAVGDSGPESSPVMANNVLWLAGNVAIFAAATWGTGRDPEARSSAGSRGLC